MIEMGTETRVLIANSDRIVRDDTENMKHYEIDFVIRVVKSLKSR